VSLRKYVSAAAIAARQDFAARGELLGRAAFYGVILLIFSRLWHVAGGGGASSEAAMLWYLAITEWVILSTPPIQNDFERDVRDGDIAYQLGRPASYVGMRLADGAGRTLARMTALGALGFPFTWWLAGSLPPDPVGVPAALALAVVAMAVSLLFQAAIGSTAVWLQDVQPLYWIWQKLLFVFGGLILPLDVYPAWLRAIGEWTPFPALLYGPGKAALHFDGAAASRTAALLVVWGAAAALLLRFVHRRGLRVLDVNGG
jgi:ABC-2 type transport system permease protein